MLSNAILAQVVLLVGLPALIVAEPIPNIVTTTSQGTYPKGGSNNNGGLLGLGNVLGLGNSKGGSNSNNNGGGILSGLNLGNVLGLGGNGQSNNGGSNNNGGNTGGNGGINVKPGSGLLNAGGLLGTGLGVDLDVRLGRPLSYNGKSVKGRRGETFDGEVLDEVLVRRQSGDAAEALRLHNAKRAERGIPALAWDPALAAAAQSWADNLARIDRMEHSPGNTRPGQGENLAYAWSSRPITSPMTQGTQAWLNEEKDYNNEIIPQGNFAAYGHYTQCMWRNTNRVGIATATNGRGTWYTVARYTPQGNINGQRPY